MRHAPSIGRAPFARHDRSQGNSPGGFTLVELLVVIAIIGILLGMLVPTVFGLIEASRTSHCQRKLGQLHTFYMQAVNNAGANKVKANTVRIYSQRYVPDGSAGSEIWGCDADPEFDINDIDNTVSYGFNVRLHRMIGGKDNKRIMALDYKVPIVEVVGWETETADEGIGNAHGDWENNVARRHRDAVNVLFHSGRADTMEPEAIDPKLAENQVKYWLPRADRVGLELYDEADEESFIPVKQFPPLPPPPEKLGTYGLDP